MKMWKTVIASAILCFTIWSAAPLVPYGSAAAPQVSAEAGPGTAEANFSPVLLAEDEGDVDDSGDAQLQDAYEQREKGGTPSPGDTTKKAAQPAGKPEAPAKTMQAEPKTTSAAPNAPKTDPESLVKGIRWLGHAAFLIEDGKSIYIDPFKLQEGLPPADIILITHDHSDHLSPGDLSKIVGESTIIVSVAAAKDRLPKKAVFRQVKAGDTLTVKDIRIEVVPAYNMKEKFHPKDMGLVGYIVHVGGRSIYHAGDTELIPEMNNIKADVALLPVGGTYTMDAADAARAANIIKPKVAVPMHYGTIVGSENDAKTFKAKCKVPVVILKVEAKPEPKPAKQGEAGKKTD